MRRRTLPKDRWPRIAAAIAIAAAVALMVLLLWGATPRHLCDQPDVADRPGCHTPTGTTNH